MTQPLPLRVAVVGLGYFSQFHLEAWGRIEKVEIVGLCDQSQDRLDDAKKSCGDASTFLGIDEMLAWVDPDILDIVSPPPTHFDFIQQAARPGRTIICQKPFCTDLEEARAAVSLAVEKGALLIVHENFRFQPWYRTLKALLRDGRIGALYQATFRLRPGDGQGADAYLDRQPFFQDMPRFLLHETGIHFIDTFRYLFGEVESVYADLRRLNPDIAGEDAGFMLLHHQGGFRALFDGNRLADHAAQNRRKTMGELLVEGSKGSLRLDGDGRLCHRVFGSNEEVEIPYDYIDEGYGGDCVYALQRHVVDHLVKQAPLENLASDYLPNIEVGEAAYRSAAEHCEVSLRCIGPESRSHRGQTT